MSSFRQKVILSLVALAGLKACSEISEPPKLAEDFTGTANLVCEGEIYKLANREKLSETVEKVAPVSLKLDFLNGRITSWSATTAAPKTAELSLGESDLVNRFEVVCSKNPHNCLPTTTEKGDTEIYFFNYKNAGLQFGGTGRLSKDLKNFGGYTKIGSEEYANAMSCKIS